MPIPSVVFQPSVQFGLQQGIHTIVQAVRPTLGPTPRLTAIQRGFGGFPELLDNGGVIARRIIQIQGRDADPGAMLTRQMLWQLHQTVGDGTASAAVIFQKIYDDGLRFLVDGGDKMRLRRYLEEGLDLILEPLAAQVRPLEGQEHLTQLAETIGYDAELAKLLGEIFDIVGEYGQFEVRAGRGRDLEREYVEGIYWNSGLISRYFFEEGAAGSLEFENPSILVSDFSLEDPADLAPLLNLLAQHGVGQLVIVAAKLSEAVTGYLYRVNRESGKLKVAGVKVPFSRADDQQAALEDMALISGGQALATATGRTLESVKPEELGQARRAWMDMDHFGIIAGKGNPRLIRQHIASLQSYYARETDPEAHQRLLERIGRIQGGSAILHVGGITEPDIEVRKENAERTGAALRSALGSGFVAGGGVAYWNCRSALQSPLRADDPLEKRAAFRILARALEEPLRTLLVNAGLELEDWLGPLKRAKPGWGIDLRTKTLGDMAATGVIDSAAVVKSVLQSAVSTAALALTVDVMVHHRNPPQSDQP